MNNARVGNRMNNAGPHTLRKDSLLYKRFQPKWSVSGPFAIARI